MTRFEIETAELARFDRRLLTDIGLGLGDQGPDASQLHRIERPRSAGAIAQLVRRLGLVVGTTLAAQR